MNPVIIIPTYICGKQRNQGAGLIETYDHMTPINKQGDLVRCLSSMRAMENKAPVVILVVAEEGLEREAVRKVRFEAGHYAGELDITVVGIAEEKVLHSRMLQIGVGDFSSGISLKGYGSVKNFGLVYAATMGYTEAIFIDDDEVVEDPEFLDKACYGLGMLTQKDIPILIKTGYFVDRKGRYGAQQKSRWYDRFWKQEKLFNEWMDTAINGPRLTSSNTAYGGCLSLHREAFRRVSFDPWIPRGEDLDFLLNVRMYGSEVWFDNMWNIRHIRGASTRNEARKFRQDMYRWMYENRKLEYSATQIDLLQIKMRTLEPYPAPFLDSSINKDMFITALLRSIGRRGQRKGYFDAAWHARKQAAEYAKANCSNYFKFQRQWPEVIALLENDIALKGVFENAVVDPISDDVDYNSWYQRQDSEDSQAGQGDEAARDARPATSANEQTGAGNSAFGDVLKGYAERTSQGRDAQEFDMQGNDAAQPSQAGEIMEPGGNGPVNSGPTGNVDDGNVVDANINGSDANANIVGSNINNSDGNIDA